MSRLFGLSSININDNVNIVEVLYFLFIEVVIGSHNDCTLQQLIVILTASNDLIGSQYVYQLKYYLLSVSIFNSKPFFPDLITSVQRLDSQRGVQMEVPRDKHLCIHKLLEPNFFRF